MSRHQTREEPRAWSPRISGKTTTLTTAGAAVTVLVWLAGLVGVDMPAEVAAALVVVVTGLAAWAIPQRTPGRYERR